MGPGFISQAVPRYRSADANGPGQQTTPTFDISARSSAGNQPREESFTGIVFALIVAAHVWRAVAEGVRIAKDPPFLSLTVLAAALSLWAWWLLGRSSRSR